jgi:hypothetical protein
MGEITVRNARRHAVVLALLATGVVVACEQGAREESGDSSNRSAASGAPVDPDPEGAVRSRIGVVFDPLTLHAGDSVAGLLVQRVDVRRAAVDSTPVGTIEFRGPLLLTGQVIPHFDSDARTADGGPPVCFEADSGSASRLPRWSGDRRRPWFCFINAGEARRRLSGADTASASPRRIRVEAFTINRGLSDEVNSARFVAVESQ